MLKIFLLGPFQLIRDQTPVPETAWHTRQARQLLKILLTYRGQIVPRDTLIDALWPDADPDKAATTLRTAVNALRNSLEPARPPYTPSRFIVAHAPGYKFQFSEQVWVDAIAFEALLEQAASAPDLPGRQSLLEQAVALYRDDFLCGDPYADWAAFERDRLLDCYLGALTDLADCQVKQGSTGRAIAGLRRVLSRDPGREPVYRTLMRHYLHLGNTVAALKTFEQLRTYLATELGAAPAPQTLALHQSILNGQLNGYTPPAISGPAVQSPLEAVFVGRRAELDALHALLADARQGRGRLVSLTGEAGVGKTRLANALLEQAAQHHLPVISARCQEVEQTLPFAPLVEALETFMLRRPGDPLQTLLPPDRAQLAQLLPSLAWEVDLQANGGGLPEHNRQRLVAGLTRTLLHLGQDGLLLFVDDLHWVDEATLSLLANLSRYLPRSKLIVLTACRPEEVTGNRPLARFLHSLARQQMLTTFTLPRLSAAEVETFLRQIAPPIAADAPLNRQLAHRLHHLTGGNPLFLVESLRALLDDIPHTLTPAAARRLLNSPTLEQPSPRVTDIILTRLEQLPPNVRVLLDITAVIGRDFSVDLLETVATTDPLPALNLLLARQFMLEPEPGRLDFSHHLIREVIYNALSPLARQRLHQRVAHALIALHGKQPGPRAAEIAAHSRRAGAARRQQALVFAVLAGDYAMRTFGFEQAARQYRQAIEWVEELPPTAELETWARQAFEGLGLAQESLADWDAARRTYQRWQSWAQKHRHPHLALVARHRLATMLGLIGQLDESAAITASVSKQASPAPPPALVRAQARLKRLISTDVSPPTWTDAGWPAFMPYPVKEARPWEGIVRALGEAQAAQTLNLFGWALTLQGQSTLAEATLLHAAQLAETHNQTGLQATSYHLLAQLWDLRGDYSNMERALSLALSLVEDAPPLRWAVIWGLIHQAYVDMRWNQLERAGERLHRLDGELSGRSAFRSHRLSVQVGLGLLAMFTGKLAQAAAYFDRALENLKNLYASNYVVVYLSRARLNRKQGNLEAAQHYIMQAMTFAGERGMLADYISAAVEAARFDRATGQPHYVIHLLQQAEAMASQAGLLPARLSARLALMRVFDDLAAPDEAAWYRRLARADRDTIAASIPTPADRSAYLARHDFKLL